MAVVTPAGHALVVYVDVSSEFGNVAEGLAGAQTSRVYSAAGAPQTLVTIHVWVPSGLFGAFPVNDVASSGLLGTGTIYDQASGMSGQTISLQFTLNTP